MDYKCFDPAPTCKSCAYYFPYYHRYDGQYLPALKGECFARRKRTPSFNTPACEKFSPQDTGS